MIDLKRQEGNKLQSNGHSGINPATSVYLDSFEASNENVCKPVAHDAQPVSVGIGHAILDVPYDLLVPRAAI